MLSGLPAAVTVLAVAGLAGLIAGLLMVLLPARAWAAVAPPRSRWAQQASVAGALLFGGLGLLGSAMLSFSAGDLWRGWRSEAWPPVEARVVSSGLAEVMQIRAGPAAYRAAVRYSYKVEGRPYTGSRLAFGNAATPQREAVEKELRTRFAPGAALQIHVDPGNPAEAVLEPGMQAKAGILTALGAVFLSLSAWQLRMLARDWQGDRLVAPLNKKARRRRA